MKKTLLILMTAIIVAGCAADYKNLYTPEKDYLERRNIETRLFDTTDEKEILIASAQVLQDMGYTIKESEVPLGVITASKNREAGSTAGKVTLTVLAALSGTRAQYEDTQRFYVSIVTAKTKDDKIKTRVTFARRTWDNYGNLLKIEKIDDPKLYQEFFDKLSKSVFLTANGI